MARLTEIDDALRCVFLSGMAQGLAPAYSVEECRTALENQWCQVTLKKRPFSLPAITIRRVDVDAAMRGAEAAAKIVRAVLAERIAPAPALRGASAAIPTRSAVLSAS